MPPIPAFYHRPVTLGEVIDQTVNRALDLIGVELEQDLFARWNGVGTATVGRIAEDQREQRGTSGVPAGS